MYAVFLICVNPLLHIYVREKDGGKGGRSCIVGWFSKMVKECF
jgi:hypothetical protein